MNLEFLIIGLIMAAVSAYLIGEPFFRPQVEDVLDKWDVVSATATDRDSVFVTLGEIEFDYRMQKLTQDDYQSLKNNYQRQAVAVIKQDRPEPADQTLPADADNDDLEQQIEREIALEMERLAQAAGKSGGAKDNIRKH